MPCAGTPSWARPSRGSHRRSRGVLARDTAQADRIAAGLEAADPDPRAVIETERQLQAARPSPERLAWIARVLDYGPASGAAC